MKKESGIIKIAAVYAGAVLGAGFASGQELMVFFVRYGVRGLWGSAIAGAMFAILGAIILVRVKKEKKLNYKEYLEMILGRKAGGVLYTAAQAFVVASFCVMLSGSGALFREQFNLPPAMGVVFTSVVCFLVLQGDLKGLTAVNMILVPFMILGMVFVCAGFLLTQHSEAWLPFIKEENNFMVSALLYVSYNMLSAAAVLVPLARLAKSNSEAARGGLLGGMALLLTAVLSCIVLYVASESLGTAELPMLTASQKLGSIASAVYAVVLYMAMLTTAAASGFAVVEHFTAVGRNRRIISAVLCIASIPLSLIPFSRLVESCYTFFGIIGLVVVCAVLYDWFRN